MEGLHTYALSAAKRKKKKKENMCRRDETEKKREGRMTVTPPSFSQM